MFKQGLFYKILTITILSAIFAGCKSKEQPQPPVVVVQKPSKQDVHIYGEYVGRIRASQFVELHARVEGYLEKMLFEEGKYVEKGEPLFVINQAQYKARVEKAKAQLKKDEASAAKASRDVERLRPLYEQHAASQLDLDNAIAALENAEANIAMSKADLDEAELVFAHRLLVHVPREAQNRGGEVVHAVHGDAAAGEGEALHVASLGASQSEDVYLEFQKKGENWPWRACRARADRCLSG